MKTRMKINWILILVLVLTLGAVQAQANYELVVSKSSLKVTGTSTLHDWHMVADKYKCEVNASMDENQDIQISSINFWCDANSVTSDNSMMDDKAHDALKSKKYADIKFTTSKLLTTVVNGGTIEGSIVGQLQIAGVTRTSELPFKGEIDTNGNITIKGEAQVKMSTYNMKAPTALMGSIKTGDEITIHYEFYFNTKK